MLVLKIIISFAIVSICFYIGIIKAKKYENREYILRESILCFNSIQSEIKYTLATLPNAIEEVRINMKTSLKDVLGLVSTEFLSTNVSNENITNYINTLDALTPYDRQVIINGLIQLGSADIEGQTGIIKLTCETLNSQLDEAVEEKKKNSKLFKTVGLACGLMITIILI